MILRRGKNKINLSTLLPSTTIRGPEVVVPAGPHGIHRGIHVLTPEDGIVQVHRGHVRRRVDAREVLHDLFALLLRQRLLAVWEATSSPD